jgi:sugar phosphate isomerase/epimerase
MSNKQSFHVGVSLHSFTDEYCGFKWSFEDLLVLVSQLGKGLEIVGPAHQRGYPYLTDEYERIFKSAVERNELIPTSYGSYADPFMLTGRDLTPDEMVEYTVPQLHAAATLGFPIVRLQYFVHPVIEKLLPLVEKLNLKVGYELHVPLIVESPETQLLVEQVTRIASPHLGIIPDAGIFSRSVSAFRIDGMRQAGMSEQLIASALKLWQEKNDVVASMATLKQSGLTDEQVGAAESLWGGYGHSDPEALRTIMPHVIHFHGKFYSMVDGDEPDLRYEEFIRVLIQSGYTGWMSSEYEGPPGVDTFEVVRAHQAMVRRYMQKAATA